MSACLALVLLTQLRPAKVPIGSDLNTIGKIRPGSYLAMRDIRSLPKVAEMSKDKWGSFTGNLYVVPDAPAKQPEILVFVNGKQRYFDSAKGTVTYTWSFAEVVNARAGSDLRVASASNVSFMVKLPDDVKKVAGFDGTLTFSEKDMKSERALQLTLKKGKVVARMPG